MRAALLRRCWAGSGPGTNGRERPPRGAAQREHAASTGTAEAVAAASDPGLVATVDADVSSLDYVLMSDRYDDDCWLLHWQDPFADPSCSATAELEEDFDPLAGIDDPSPAEQEKNVVALAGPHAPLLSLVQ